MALLGAGQHIYADGCNLGLFATNISHSSSQSVADSHGLEHMRKARVYTGIQDSSVTLEGYYDPERAGLAALPNFPRVNRLQHVLGDSLGANVLTYNHLIADKRSFPTDGEGALVKPDVSLLQTGDGPTNEWVYGGRVILRRFHGLTSAHEYFLGDSSVYVNAENIVFDKQTLLNNTSRIEVFFHFYAWSFTTATQQNVSVRMRTATLATTSIWSLNAFTTTSLSSGNAAPGTGTSFSDSVTRRYLAPSIVIGANMTIDLDFAMFYRDRA